LIAAVLTAFFFGVTPPIASRATKLMGFVRANVVRLSIAVLVLGSWAIVFGPGLKTQGEVFVMAGAIGFGIGGLAFLAALPRLGAPLASLIEESVAAIVLVVVATYYYSEDKLNTQQLAYCGVILLGIAIGLLPYVLKSGLKEKGRNVLALGVVLVIVAAVAQGISLAATRHGQVFIKKATQAPPDIITVASLRLAGGVIVAIAIFLIARYVWRRKWGFTSAEGTEKALLSSDGGKLTSRPLFWGGLNALTGPILGVTCTVWAQQSYSGAVVQSIAALAPMIAVPFAFWLEGHKPPRLWYVGAVVAITGVILLWQVV
jgi:drug/metabolite transporter (DMT)-like permease